MPNPRRRAFVLSCLRALVLSCFRAFVQSCSRARRGQPAADPYVVNGDINGDRSSGGGQPSLSGMWEAPEAPNPG